MPGHAKIAKRHSSRLSLEESSENASAGRCEQRANLAEKAKAQKRCVFLCKSS
jgi:hypothetical protein